MIQSILKLIPQFILKFIQRRADRQQNVAFYARKERMEVRDDILDIIGRVIQFGSVSDNDIASFAKSVGKAQELFDTEVIELLRKGYEFLSAHNCFEGTGEPEKKQAAFDKIKKFSIEFEKSVEPYIRLREKMPPS